MCPNLKFKSLRLHWYILIYTILLIEFILNLFGRSLEDKNYNNLNNKKHNNENF